MKISYLARLLIAVILTLSASANAEPTSDKAKAADMPGKDDLQLPPANVSEFIQNIKYFIENDLLLEKDFFTQKNLMRFSNARNARNLGDRKDVFFIEGVNITGIGPAIEAFSESNNDKQTVRIGVSFKSGSISAAYLIKTFGNVSRIEDPYKDINSFHPEMVSSKTDRYGNMAITQLIVVKRTNTKIYSIIAGDGSVSRINIIQTRDN